MEAKPDAAREVIDKMKRAELPSEATMGAYLALGNMRTPQAKAALEGSDDPFLSIRHNPYVATTSHAGEVVNAWTPADDCASIDLTVHAKTSE